MLLRWMRKAILKLRDEILKKKKRERGLRKKKKDQHRHKCKKWKNCLAAKGKKCKQQSSGQKL